MGRCSTLLRRFQNSESLSDIQYSLSTGETAGFSVQLMDIDMKRGKLERDENRTLPCY